MADQNQFGTTQTNGVRSQDELREWNKKQIAEALGNDNLWFAGKYLGRSPSPAEAMSHYITHGGATSFAQRHQGG